MIFLCLAKAVINVFTPEETRIAIPVPASDE